MRALRGAPSNDGAVFKIAIALAALPVIGSAGFVLIEGWGWFDALYMSILTLTTVGYMEVHPLSTAGRSFVMVYLLIGLGIFFYGVVELGERVVRSELGGWLGKRNMDTAIKSMKDHVIVCGYGRMGRVVCRELAAQGVPFVVIDRDEESLAELRGGRSNWLVGDATDDATLQRAGIERAQGLAAVLPQDADNVFLVLSARMLTKSLTIMARATDDKSNDKLKRAGADRVINLYEAGATKMAQLFSNPKLDDFVELFASGDSEIDLAEVHVSKSSIYAGKRLKDTDFSERGVIIVGIRSASGKLAVPPPSSMAIAAGDSLIAVGHASAISKLIELS